MSSIANRSLVGSLGYVLLLASSLYANKYVLTVLGFRYPMVFQGWQCIVGFLVFKAMAYLKVDGLHFGLAAQMTKMDKPGLVSLLPNFVLFVVFVISGSKAVSTYPVLAFVCATNVLPAVTFLIDSWSSNSVSSANSILQKGLAFVAIPSGAAVVWAATKAKAATGKADEEGHDSLQHQQLIYDAAFWLAVHLMCGIALSFHSRIADQRYSYSERLFYSYVFALVVLLPASLYLEEAFEALNFQHRRQMRFLLGSVFSAGAGVALSLCQARLKEDPLGFGRLHHSGLAGTALLSAAVFPETTEMAWWGWIAAVVNLGSVILVPSHIRPDEKIQAASNGGLQSLDQAPNTNAAVRRHRPKKHSQSSAREGVVSGGGAVSINLDGGGEEEDRVALLGAPSDEDLEVGMINENSRHLS